MRQLSRSMQSVVTDVRVDWGADLTAALVLSTTPTRPVFSGDRVSCYGVFRRALLPSSATVTLSIKGPSGGQSWALPLEFAAPVDAPVDAPATGAVARLRGRAAEAPRSAPASSTTARHPSSQPRQTTATPRCQNPSWQRVRMPTLQLRQQRRQGQTRSVARQQQPRGRTAAMPVRTPSSAPWTSRRQRWHRRQLLPLPRPVPRRPPCPETPQTSTGRPP